MTKIMYKASVYGKPITTVEIERETDKFVLIVGHVSRDAKQRDGEGYFDTYADAKAFLVRHYQYVAETHQKRLDGALEKLQQAENLQETP
jgi:hypothetical protein